ncbi:MAG: ABC transporter substrate-binding protein [Chloroflexi bacterium]|nr:ABC transporter substrate-binding protein [Chloroflexota bacterium]
MKQLGFLLGAALLLASCGGTGGSTAQSNASKPLTPLNGAYASTGTNALATWVAQDQGFFRQQGLDVNLSYIEGSVNAAPALSGGDVSIVDVTAQAAIQGQLKGLDMVVLAVHAAFSREHLMAGGGINTVADLKGKAIGATRAGSLDDLAAKAALKKQGFEPGKDVSMSYFGTQAAQVAALQSGNIASIIVPAPYDGQAKQAGGHEIDLERIAYPADGIISSRKFVSEHQDQAVAFLTGYVQGLRFLRSNPDASKQVLAKYTKQDDPNVLNPAFDDLLANLVDNPTPTTDGIQNALSQLDGGEGKNPADFVDTTPIARALAAVK